MFYMWKVDIGGIFLTGLHVFASNMTNMNECPKLIKDDSVTICPLCTVLGRDRSLLAISAVQIENTSIICYTLWLDFHCTRGHLLDYS